MVAGNNAFERSVSRQISLHKARTPTERLNVLCDLLDVVRAMAPSGPDARERRHRALAVRERDREELRAHCGRLLTARRSDAPEGRSSRQLPFAGGRVRRYSRPASRLSRRLLR